MGLLAGTEFLQVTMLAGLNSTIRAAFNQPNNMWKDKYTHQGLHRISTHHAAGACKRIRVEKLEKHLGTLPAVCIRNHGSKQ